MHAPPRVAADAGERLALGRPRVLPTACIALLGVVLVAAFAAPLGLLICAGLALYAWRGARETIEAFTVLALLLLLGNDGAASIGRWLVLFSCCGRLAWDSVMQGAPTPRILRPLALFAATIMLFAWLVSYIPAVSILKVVTFTMGVGAIMTGLYRTPHLREYWFSWFFTFGIFVLFASLPLYATAYGYRFNGSGFQGILSHPQSYGVVAAPITAFLTGLVLFYDNRSPVVVLGALLGWVGIFASQARTSFLAAAGALAISVMIGYFLGPAWRATILRAFSAGRVALIVVVFSALAVAQWSSIQEGVRTFLLKDDSDESVVESLQSSRIGLIERSLDNFMEEPLTGIGFGVPSDPGLLRVKTGPLGIPLGASVEKGFMPSAVLEETGLVGAILVAYLILVLLLPVLRQGGMMVLWVLIACLMINGGEMVFFSIGAGDGVYLWLLMGFCHYFVNPSLLQARVVRVPYRRPSPLQPALQ